MIRSVHYYVYKEIILSAWFCSLLLLVAIAAELLLSHTDAPYMRGGQLRYKPVTVVASKDSCPSDMRSRVLHGKGFTLLPLTVGLYHLPSPSANATSFTVPDFYHGLIYRSLSAFTVGDCVDSRAHIHIGLVFM